MAFIFDLDGTLLNTLDDLGNSCNRTLAYFNYPTHPLEAYNFFVGNGMKKLLERALPSNFNGNFDAVLEFFLQDYAKNYANDSRPYEGVLETLQQLNKRNIPIAVCTNKKQEYTDAIMKQYFDTIRFEAIIGDTFDGYHKPHPKHPLEIASIMDVNPSEIFFVGDSNVDIITAQNAGMKAIGVSWGFRPKEELILAGADIVIDEMSAVLQLN